MTHLRDQDRNVRDVPRVSLVTGAASGIGKAVALRLARDGWAVGVLDRDVAGALAVAEEIHSIGAEAHVERVDVVDADQMASAAASVKAALGEVAGVVACAGIEVLGTVLDVDLDQWQRALDVNLTGVFSTAKATMPQLLRTRGSFVAIASDAGTAGAQGYAAYAASKHGVIGLIRCLALDFGPDGVRSNVVSPGYVETPMVRRIFADSTEDEADSYSPLGRFARPDEVAAAVAHLLGPESSYTNGLVYSIDGGGIAGPFRRLQGD